MDDTAYSVGLNPTEAIVIDLSKDTIKLGIPGIPESVYSRKGLCESGCLKESSERVVS